MVDIHAEKLLRRHVGGCAEHGSGVCEVRSLNLRNTEIHHLERAVIEQPNHVATRRHLIESYALAGCLDQARHSVDVLLRMAPYTRISRMADWSGPLTPAYMGRLADAYRLAGMPE